MPDTQRIHNFNLQFAKAALDRRLVTQEQLTECLAETAGKTGGEEMLRQLPDVMVEKGYLDQQVADGIRKELEGMSLPSQIASYAIEGVIGRGGMGIVYKARTPETNEPVALKVVRISALKTGTALERFKREARALTLLKHPNITRGIEVGEYEGSQFIAMEYVVGRGLNEVVKESGPLSQERALDIAIAVADALAYAHSKQMIHRDIKPNNILIGSGNTTKLLDFGLSKSEEDNVANLTLPGTGMGTPYYMPPEQIRGAKNVDQRGDIYSLGATMYEAVTGKRTLEGKPMEVLLKLERGAPITPPEELRPDLHPGFVRILKKMIEREPENRHQSARELLRDLISLRNELANKPRMKETPAASGSSGSAPAASHSTGKQAAVKAKPGQVLYHIRYKKPDGGTLVKQYTEEAIILRIRKGRFKAKTLVRIGESGGFVRLDTIETFSRYFRAEEDTVDLGRAAPEPPAEAPPKKEVAKPSTDSQPTSIGKPLFGAAAEAGNGARPKEGFFTRHPALTGGLVALVLAAVGLLIWLLVTQPDLGGP